MKKPPEVPRFPGLLFYPKPERCFPAGVGFNEGTWEARMESCQYRGYQIEARREWSNWCVSVYRTRPELPILPQPTLHVLTTLKDDALVEAKQSIDHVLSNLDS
jgi:hypothetical protein